jgi:hypothetical protein
MRLATGCFVIALAFAMHLPVAATPACADSALRLNEIMAGPASDWDSSGTFSSRDDEWVELLNTSSALLALDGYFLTDGDSIPRYAFSGTLAAGARRIVYGIEAYDWERLNGFPAFGLSLGNSGDAVLLWKVEAGDTLLVDSYSYTSHQAAADRSVGRHPEDGSAWALFDALNPYSGSAPPHGNGCAPSPNAQNLCGLTPARAATWGEVKARYR